MTKGKRSVMPKRVSSSCPKPQTDFNKLCTVFAHTTTIFKTGIYCMSSEQLCIMNALKWNSQHRWCAVSTCVSDAYDWLIRNAVGILGLICQTNNKSYELLSMRLGTSSGFCVHLLWQLCHKTSWWRKNGPWLVVLILKLSCSHKAEKILFEWLWESWYSGVMLAQNQMHLELHRARWK